VNESSSKRRLLQVTGLFLKLGAIRFGGPAAHIALMEQEAVRKRNWLSREHFMDLLAATNLVPGPNATEMAVHIGFVHAGWPGLIAGGVAFIVPAFLISLVLAVIYVHFGTLPQGAALHFAYGINPAVMAIVLTATYRLGQTALKDKRAIVLSVACLVAALLGVNEVVVLLATGLNSAVGHPDGLADPERHRADGGTGYHIHAERHPCAAFDLNVGGKERDVQVFEQVRASFTAGWHCHSWS